MCYVLNRQKDMPYVRQIEHDICRPGTNPDTIADLEFFQQTRTGEAAAAQENSEGPLGVQPASVLVSYLNVVVSPVHLLYTAILVKKRTRSKMDLRLYERTKRMSLFAEFY